MQAMIQSPMLPVLMGGIGALFVVLFIIGQVMARSTNARGMNARLEQFGGKSSSADKNISAEALAKIDAVVSKSKRGGAMARDLARADLKMKVSEFVALKIAAALLGAAIGAYLGRASTAAMIGTGLIGAVLFSFTPNIYVNFRAANRIKSFNNQLGDTITMMANALRGGYSFLQTLDMVSKEAPSPVSDEFRRIVQEVGLGRTTEESLDALMRRVPSDDLDLLITAVKIQMEVGGNLAQILDTIGHTIRERARPSPHLDSVAFHTIFVCENMFV